MTDTTTADPVRRVAKAERIVALDVIRGVAILAILAMNIPLMGGYAPNEFWDPRLVSWTAADQATMRFVDTFLDGTQRGLLELLFGAGIMIMTRAAMKPDGPVAVADLHFRRNLWLIAFGVFQALVLMWPGDILFPYGIVAIFAFPFRTLGARWKALIGVVFILVAVAPGLLRYQERIEQRAAVAAAEAKIAKKTPLTAAEQDRVDAWKDRLENLKPLAQSPKKQRAVAEEKKARLGSLADYSAFLREVWFKFNFDPGAWFGWSEILGTMLLGMALFDWGVLSGRRSAGLYLALLLVGYGVGAPLRWLADADRLRFLPNPKPGWITWDIARMALTLGHVGLINLILKAPLGARILGVFQAPGRMPLTVYLSASVICMWILFPGVGFGLFGRYGWAGLEAIALMVMAAQLVFANVWLTAFETGPVDWAWKSLAYRKRQPFRRAATPAGAAAPAPAE